MTKAAVVPDEQKTIPIALESTPIGLLSQAMSGGASLEHIKCLIDFRDKHERDEAKKAYTVAMAKFKIDNPKIIKDQEGSIGDEIYNYASIATITGAINPALGKYGLCARWAPEQTTDKVSVTCIVTHELGHSESATLSSPPDVSERLNLIRATSRVVTLLSRYTLLAVTGMATAENEDDGAGFKPKEPETPPVVSVDKFKEGIDYFKKEKFSAEDLDKWFSGYDDSFELLEENEAKEVESYLLETYSWLDANGKFARKDNKKSETVKCPGNGKQMMKEDCLQSECHKTCKAMGNTPKSKLESSI
jgi:ERF superfamily